MGWKTIVKESFVVIGKEGSTLDGPGFVQNLWQQANQQFDEIKHLAKTNELGQFVGFWGAMSDFSRSFLPWTNNFSEGLYLAGVECNDDAQAPEGWTKWCIPGFEYLYVELQDEKTFLSVIEWMSSNNISLVGAVHDFTCPVTSKNYMCFPIRKL